MANNKYNVTGNISTTIEVEGKEIKIYNGAVIELPAGGKDESRLKAKGWITPYVEKEAKMFDHVVTEEDLKSNPDLEKQGVKVGDTIQVPVSEKTNKKKKLTNNK